MLLTLRSVQLKNKKYKLVKDLHQDNNKSENAGFRPVHIEVHKFS
jgi:hypothetical protein